MRLPIELLTLLYMLSYLPYMVIAKWLSSPAAETLGRPLSGLEILPAGLLLSGLMTIAFVWIAGWWKDANQVRIGGFSVVTPTKWTFISGLCTGLVLLTVPLSLTFDGVSIPFIQLMMKGAVLILAPIVDFISRRKVHWWSWGALGIVCIGLFLTLNDRGGLEMPPLAIASVVLYTIGFFGRLMVMSHVSKSGDDASVRRYFVEEKLIGIPFAIIVLMLLPYAGLGAQSADLAFGFTQIWTSPQMPLVAALAFLLFLVSVFSAVILLDKRENTFCVPLERSASVIAGLMAAFVLWIAFGLDAPAVMEIVGAFLMVCAVVLLSLAPRLSKPRNSAPVVQDDREAQSEAG